MVLQRWLSSVREQILDLRKTSHRRRSSAHPSSRRKHRDHRRTAIEGLEDRALLAAAITIDGDFSDWAQLPSYTDPANDEHDTDHDQQGDTPALVDHPDVDVLNTKVTHDAENFYFYFQASGQIGRTQAENLSQGLRAGRYYVIVTIDVDNDDSTGYWLHEGGYFPTTDGYDVNAEIEFYNGQLNTRHYLQHGATTEAELEQAFADQSNGLYVYNGPQTQGPFAPGFVDVLPGVYDYYTQWVYKENDPALSNQDSITFVQDKGPIVLGIADHAVSADGHELEMVFPFKGFLNDEFGNPLVELGKTVDISFSLEASGELSNEVSPQNPNGSWASDTADPVIGYVLTDPLDFGDAPASYSTLLADNGARHGQAAGLFLGTNVDSEVDGQPGAAADDDRHDDSVVLTSAIQAGQLTTGTITASGAGFLNGWLDYNGDGDWDDPGEQFVTDQALSAGSNPLNFQVPLSAVAGQTYARLRFSSTPGLSFDGAASDGEVEDYYVTIDAADSTDLSVLKSSSAESVFQGGAITYEITVSNNGPTGVVGATVLDMLPDELSSATWSAVFSGGATGNASGSGDLNEQVDLPAGGSIVYTISGQLAADTDSFVMNSVSVTAPAGILDTDLSNNAAYEVDRVARNTSQSRNVFVPGSPPPGIDTTDPIKEAAFGDLNGDGWVDAVFAHVVAGHQVWLNDGAGTLVNTGQSLGVDPSPVPSHHALGTELGDLDNDGDLDLLILNKAVQATWLNDGSGIFAGPGMPIAGIPVSEAYEVELADLDGDGDLDAVVADDDGTNFGGNGANLLLFNDGSGDFTQVVSLPAASDLDTWDTAVGDFDGDGDVDAVFANFNSGQTSELWLNDGTGVFSKDTQTFGGKLHWNVETGDLDGDGDLDLMFVVNTSDPDYVEVWINDGAGNFSANGQRTFTTEAGLGGVEGLEIGDLDGDGDLDAFLSTFGEVGAILVWANDGSGNFAIDFESVFIVPTPPETAVGGWRSRLADPDGDGDLDAFVFEGEHELLHYFENTNGVDTPTALDNYVAEPDSSYGFNHASTLTGTGYTAYILDLTSQTWRIPAEVDKTVWQHWVTVIVPDVVTEDQAFLYIHGGSTQANPPSGVDNWLTELAVATGSVVIDLPTVPNQPLTFTDDPSNPRYEDEIIAYTFDKYLNGGDDEWPLLLPMVNSAVRTMDAVQTFVPDISVGAIDLNGFTITGASKRGWTTWLTAAVDPRVTAIAPMVIDVLSFQEQMTHHVDRYRGITEQKAGDTAEVLHDYVDFGLIDKIISGESSDLLPIVDPFTYLDRPAFQLPKYVVNSTGDEFFVPDSSQFYFTQLPGQQNYLRYVPNTGHGLNGSAIDGIGAFYDAVLDGATLPEFSWTMEDNRQTIRLQTMDTPAEVRLWQATNLTNRDFRISTFGPGYSSSLLADSGGGEYVAAISPPASGATAFFIEMIYDVNGTQIPFTTDVSVVSSIDYGDAPDTSTGTGPGNYQTLVSDDGAGHLIVPGLFMGSGVDPDTDGFHDGIDANGDATDDDSEGSSPDDENGVNDPAADLLLSVGESPAVDVTVTNTIGESATLYGWIDYNGDGAFDNASERASASVASGTTGATVTLTFPPVPVDTVSTAFARFRLSSDTVAADPTGLAFNGEVEDYAFHRSTTCLVVNTNDAGAGSLREAINCANADPGLNTIAFAIPTSDSGYVDVDSTLSGGDVAADAFLIRPLTPLPALSDATGGTFIDGRTQATFGADTNPFGPEIILDGSLAGASAHGLEILSNHNSIVGLNVQKFTRNGLFINGGDHNWLAGNYVGTDATGTTAMGNANTAGDLAGIQLSAGAASNLIGTNGDGQSDATERNVISANKAGLNIDGVGSDNNVVAGNFVGTDATGTLPLGNTNRAVRISYGAQSNLIGTDSDGVADAAERNVLAGGNSIGVIIDRAGTSDNVVAGNFIGTDVNGTLPLANGTGVWIASGAQSNLIGTNADGIRDAVERNVISGNTSSGVEIVDTGTSGNVVSGNFIGTDVTGTVSVSNAVWGVLIYNGPNANRIGTNGDGQFDAAERNVISGNGREGVVLAQGVTQNVVAGNFIGTAVDGTSPLGNGESGIAITLGGANSNRIGGIGADANTIAFNGHAGVLAVDNSTGNSIRGNSIHSNATIGIDLGGTFDLPTLVALGDGVTLNDPGDSDSGDNNLQNFPTIASVTTGASTRVTGTLNSLASATYTIDFYANTAADPSGHGEGERHLGSTSVTTDSGGNGLFDVTLAAATTAGEFISATATDANGNTSEFSLAASTLKLLLQIDSGAIDENGNATATVSRNNGTVGNLAVNVTTDDSSELSIPASVMILDGNDSVTFPVSGVSDMLVDGTQTASVSVSTDGYLPASATIDVTDVDVAVVTVTSESKNEGTGGTPTTFTFSVDLSHPVDAIVSMMANTQDGTATAVDDFTAVSGQQVSFAAGDTTTQTVDVLVDADSDTELDEAFDLVMSNLSAGGLNVVFDGEGPTLTSTATILNDDNAPAAARIIDDGDAGFSTVGSWPRISNKPQVQEGDFLYNGQGTGQHTATWTFDAVTPGLYRVSTSYRAFGNRATNAPFTIRDGAAFLTTVPVNQQQAANSLVDDGIPFQDLGEFNIVSGTLTVELSDNADGLVIADAVRIERLGDVVPGPEIQVSVDGGVLNDDTGVVDFGEVEADRTVSKVFTVTNLGTTDLTLTDPISVPSGFTLTSGFGTNVLAPFATTTFEITVDNSVLGSQSGQVSFANDDVADDENPFNFTVQANVVPATGIQIIDNGDAGYSTAGNWVSISGNLKGHQNDFQYANSGTGSNTASWAFDVEPGQYLVAATWKTHSNRSTAAPYTIYNDTAAILTATADQSVPASGIDDDGSSFAPLGTFNISSTRLVVTLSDNATGLVIADAIRIERVGDIPSGPEIGVIDDGADVADDTGVVDFGDVEQGEVVVRTLTVFNFGTTDLTLTEPITTSAGFTATNFGTTTLPANQSTTFDLEIDTSVLGTLNGTVSFGSNDSDENPFNFAVQGNVIPASTIQVIDNSDGSPGFSQTGSWVQVNRNGHNGGFHFASGSGTGGSTSTWTFDVADPGLYRVSATWRQHSNRASNARFTLNDDLSSSVHVDQRVAPNVSNGIVEEGSTFEDLGTFRILGNTLTVTLDNLADGLVIADAIRIERVGD